MNSETYDLNAYQTTEEPKEVLTAEKIEEMENFVAQNMKDGTLEEDKREASSLGQGGYGKVDEHSGTYAYSMPVHIPTPQNNGPVPKISIVYNSRGSNNPSLIASGWRLELGRIERVPEEGGYMDFENDQGQPGAKTHFILQLNGRNYTLVKVQGKENLFRSKIENSFIEAERFPHKDMLDPDSGKTVIDYWKVRNSEGKLFTFGAVGDDGDIPGEVLNKRWNIVSIEDAYGQKVVYEYEHYIKPGSPHAGHEKSYSYPTCVKVGMTKDASFWDTEVRFIYRKDDALDPNEGYYFLDTQYTGREDSGIVSVIWKRLIAVETYYKNEDGKMILSRRMNLEASIHAGKEKFWVDSINETGYKYGEHDPSTDQPSHKFEYEWKDPQNIAMMVKSTSPLSKIEEVEYDLATNVDKEAFGMDGIYLVTSFTERTDKDAWTKSYKYLGGKRYTPWGEYRGHRKVEVYEEQTKHRIETHYTQTGVHNGYVLKQYKRDANNKLISTLENTWMALNYNGGRYMPFTSESVQREYSEDGKTVLFAELTQIPKINARENPWEYAIDKYGNALVQIETTYDGDIDNNSFILQKKTETIYRNINEGNLRFIGLPGEIKKYARYDQEKDYQLTEWTENTYNTIGQLIESIKHYDSKKPENAYKTTTEYHMQTGNVIRKYRFDGSKRLLVEEVNYYNDGPYKYLKENSINALGQIEKSIQYDLQFRSPSYVIASNNMITQTRYDGIGRTIEENYAGQDHSKRENKKESVQYVYTLLPEERSIETLFIYTKAKKKEFFDPLNRKYKTFETGYEGKLIVKEHTEFDFRTRNPARVFEPYFIDEKPTGYTSIEYADPRLRKTKEIGPSGCIESIYYDGFKKIKAEENFKTDRNENIGERLNRRIVEEIIEDSMGRVVSRAEGSTDSDTRYEIYYTYDILDRLVKVTDSMGVTLKTVDYGSRLDDKPINVFDVSLGNSEMRYNRLGLLESTKSDFNTNLDRLSILKYDVMDRIVERLDKDEVSGAIRTIISEYDTAPNGIGQIAMQKVDEQDEQNRFIYTKRYKYDDFGTPELINYNLDIKYPEVKINESFDVSISYVSNPLKCGRMEKVSHPAINGFKGDVVEYFYDDKSGLLTGIKFNNDSVWRVENGSFTARDQVKMAVSGNGIVTKQNYDLKTGRINSIETMLGTKTLMSHSITCDTSGNVKERVVKTLIPSDNGNEESTSMEGLYSYNEKDQLIESSENGKKQLFSYKANGSRIRFLDDSSETIYEYEDTHPHRIKSLSGAHDRQLAYDNAGNLVKELNINSQYLRNFVWNPSNRLKTMEIIDPEQKKLCSYLYGYGGELERVFMYDKLHDKLLLYIDDSMEIEWSRKNNRKIARTHIMDASRRIATFEQETGKDSRLYYYHRDHLNSIIQVTDETGQIVNSTSYEPFGIISKNSGKYKPTIHFTGHRIDVENIKGFSQYDFEARQYDPQLGIFISPDKVEDSENVAFGLNRYVYVNNNPLSKFDPTGFGLLDYIEKGASAVGDAVSTGWDYTKMFGEAVGETFASGEARQSYSQMCIGAVHYASFGYWSPDPEARARELESRGYKRVTPQIERISRENIGAVQGFVYQMLAFEGVFAAGQKGIQMIQSGRGAVQTPTRLYSYFDGSVNHSRGAFTASSGRLWASSHEPGAWLTRRGVKAGWTRWIRTGRVRAYQNPNWFTFSGRQLRYFHRYNPSSLKWATAWKTWGGQYSTRIGINGFRFGFNPLSPSGAPIKATAWPLIKSIGGTGLDMTPWAIIMTRSAGEIYREHLERND